MAQPVSQGNLIRISGTAAGTTLISDAGVNFNSVSSGNLYTGTVTFYDSATAAGTTATNLLIAYNNNTGTIPSSITPMGATKKGLVAVVGGTTDVLVSFG